MKLGLTIAGVVLVIVGMVWIGQGANLIAGSFMTGQRLWLVLGLLTAGVGAGLIWWAIVGYRRFP